MNKRLEKAHKCDVCGEAVTTGEKGAHFKEKHPEYVFTMFKMGVQNRIVCVRCLKKERVVVLGSYGDLVKHYRGLHMKEKISISCRTCDRENCLLARKSIRRFLVALLGCNYWMNKKVGYIPDGDVPYKLEPQLTMVIAQPNVKKR